MKKTLNQAFWMFLILMSMITVFTLLQRTQRPDNEVHPEWITDFEAAKSIAQQQGKDLFINFAGSDWCYWCKRLDAEVLREADFVIPAQEGFVFVLIDFPANKSGQNQALQLQNERLKQQFAVEGFPTIILADEDGNSYARTGYQEGGPKVYLRHIQELQSGKNQLTLMSK